MINAHVLFLFLCLFSELWAYKNFTVENPYVCSDVSKRTVKLGTGTDSGVLITQRRLGDHRIEWKKDWRCSFDVRSRGFIGQLIDEPTGVFAVIQRMQLRRDPDTHACIDYIQFKDTHGVTSPRLCGTLDAQHAMDKSYAHIADADDDDESSEEDFGYDRVVSLLNFDDPLGQLTVYIFIDQKPLERGEHTDFLIAFTGYKHCRNDGYRACANDRSKCIYEAFFHDGIINCPYYDCSDEGGCKAPPVEVDKPLTLGSHILIGSATSLVVSFLVFVVCLYTCRKYGKLCWSEEFSRGTTQQTPSQVAPSSGGGGNATVQETMHLHTPTAPSLPPSPPPMDKDMPPSYDSLFPQDAARR